VSYTLDFPIQYFPNPEKFGSLGLGLLYIGVVDGDPAAEPADRIQVYIARQNDTDLAIPQPIDLSSGGVPTYLGSPVTLKINQKYSAAVMNRSNEQIYYSPKAGEMIETINDFNDRIDDVEDMISEVVDGAVTVIENVAALSSITAVNGRLYELKEYNANKGKGGGPLVGKVGAITPNNVTTFAGAAGTYFERLGTPDPDMFDSGAVGDGVADDSAAFLRLAAATNGKITAKVGEYLINNLTVPVYPMLSIHGSGMPLVNGTLSKLVGGTIFVGGINAQSNALSLSNFGIDAGSGRTAASIDGGVFNAVSGQLGVAAAIRNVASLQPTQAGTRHALLVQGYERAVVQNVYAAEAEFGLVTKCRYTDISNINGDKLRTALVYPKSDVSAFSGGVANGSAARFNVSNVNLKNTQAMATGSAVFVHASTLSFSGANISNVDQTYGFAALRVSGGGLISDPSASSVNATNINSDSASYAFSLEGYNYDVCISNAGATNPSTGRIAYIDGNSTNYAVNNLRLTISDAGIAGTTAIEFLGFGTWDNITVRDPFTTRTIDVGAGGLANRICGQHAGNCRLNRDEDLTGINGAVHATEKPIIRVLPGSVIKLTGRFDVTSLINKAFCNIPINTGKQQIFACGGINSADQYVTIAVRLNDFQLSIEPSLPAGFKFIDLSGITINMMG